MRKQIPLKLKPVRFSMHFNMFGFVYSEENHKHVEDDWYRSEKLRYTSRKSLIKKLTHLYIGSYPSISSFSYEIEGDIVTFYDFNIKICAIQIIP